MESEFGQTRPGQATFSFRPGYVVCDSTLKLESRKTKAGYHGPELTTWGSSRRSVSTKCRGTSRRVQNTDSPHSPRLHLAEPGFRGAVGGSEDVGCNAVSDPEFEQPRGFEKHNIGPLPSLGVAATRWPERSSLLYARSGVHG